MFEAAYVTMLVLAGWVAGSAGAAMVMRRAFRGRGPIDQPDSRRMHRVATPRGGGVGLAVAGTLATLAGMWLTRGREGVPVSVVGLAWALPNGVLGWIDDHRPLRSRTKFAIQCAAAVSACALGLRVRFFPGNDAYGFLLEGTPAFLLAAGEWLFSILWLVWMANVFNFMDGIDAFAAGAGLMFFSAFAFISGRGALDSLGLAAALAAACAGFLRFNWPPARVFMGDGGALYAGAALGGLAVVLAQTPGVDAPFIGSLFVLGTFLWDATYTIAWRVLMREPMLPHRTHLYQRLVLAGWSPGRVRLMFLTLTMVSALAGLAYPHLPSTGKAGLVGAALLVGAGIVVVTRALEKRTQGRSSVPGAS